jgi:hypothetical protein
MRILRGSDRDAIRAGPGRRAGYHAIRHTLDIGAVLWADRWSGDRNSARPPGRTRVGSEKEHSYSRHWRGHVGDIRTGRSKSRYWRNRREHNPDGHLQDMPGIAWGKQVISWFPRSIEITRRPKIESRHITSGGLKLWRDFCFGLSSAHRILAVLSTVASLARLLLARLRAIS